MSEEILKAEREGAIAVITLNRPHTRNALDFPLTKALAGALEQAAADTSVRAIVLTGAGGAFCAGADLKSALAENAALFERLDQSIDLYHAMVRAIVSAPKPVIAMVDGPAVGFGCDLAFACDLRVISTEAYFQEKFVKIGLMPDGGGTYWLPRLVGLGRAMELILTGEAIRADKALELGIASRMVAPGQLRTETMALADKLAKGPPIAFAEIKKVIGKSFQSSIEETLAAEKAGQMRCLMSADCLEGVTAWMQRREPVFEGK